MAAVHSFRELDAYKIAHEQAGVIFQLTKRFPKDETDSLTDQIRRSSRAVGAMIAEGWARRRYEAAFANKKNEAMAEATETQAWLDYATDCGDISQAQHDQIDDRRAHIGAMLNRMIDRAADFCRPTQNCG